MLALTKLQVKNDNTLGFFLPLMVQRPTVGPLIQEYLGQGSIIEQG